MSCCCQKPDPAPTCCSSRKKKIDLLFWIPLVLVLLAYPAHLFLHGSLPGPLATFARGVHELANKMWWGVLLGVLALGILSKVPRDLVQAALGPGGTPRGILRACGAGLLLDLCNHGILMVGAKLYERGASLGQVLAFLVASPWNSLTLTLILWSLIGWKWTLLIIAASALIAILTGLLADLLVRKTSLPANPHSLDLPENFSLRREIPARWKNLRLDRPFFTSALKTALTESRMVLRWILLGTLLAAALRALLPAEAFAHWFGPTLGGLLLTLLGATLLEVCSEGSSPVAADLLNRAHAPGNAFAFLMAGASTDYTEIAVLRQTTRSWKLTLLLPLLTLPQITALSLLLNSL